MNTQPRSGVSRSQNYLAGMPHLARAGLSENWLLKECGHQHWLLLAQLHGLAVPSFADREGRPAYAAFTAVALDGLRLETVGENAALQLHSQLLRAGRARHYSEHQLLVDGRSCGNLQMLSTFVCRLHSGDNRSATRAVFTSGECEAPEPSAAAQALQATGKRWRDAGGVSEAEAGLTWAIRPCPELDFNGADFLYFAQFQAAAERAEWELQMLPASVTCRKREMYFYGNLNPGDSLALSLRPAPGDPFSHHCEVRRASDGHKLADILTHKQPREQP